LIVDADRCTLPCSEQSTAAVVIQNGTFRWNAVQSDIKKDADITNLDMQLPTLENVQLTAERGKLIAGMLQQSYR
jgi:hypothetical protein